jgi:Tfp pilus assembly protein PilF
VYHITNIILHAANGLLVVWLLTVITKNRAVGIIGGLLFVVHPLHTEAVVWLSGRKDLLFALWMLLSFIFYIRWREGVRRAYVWSVLFFILALLSKVTAAMLPAILLLYEMFLSDRRINKKTIINILPYITFSALFIVIALAGKERIVASSTMLETILMAGKSTVFYIEKIFIPVNFSVFYPYSGEVTLSSPDFFIPALFVIVLGVFTIYSLKWTKWIAFGIGFYLLTLAPTFLNFHKGAITFFAVDRYAYIPSIGILLIVALALHRFIASGARKTTVAVLVLVMCLLSFLQTRVWEDPERLMLHSLALYPDSISARTDLARMYREAGRYQDGFEILKEGLVYGDHPALHLAAGYIYAKVGQVRDAEEQFESARLMNPKHPDPIFSLGSLKEQIGDKEAALIFFTKAVEMDPSYVVAHVRLSSLLMESGQIDLAKEHLTEALRWNPNSGEAHAKMAELLTSLSQPEKAAWHRAKAEAIGK